VALLAIVRILVVNAGSQSVKLRVIGDGDEELAATDLGPPDEKLASQLGRFLEDAGEVDVAGHRVVHGGSVFTEPVIVDDRVRAALEDLSDLAPLHNPPAIAALDVVRRTRPAVPSVACFDTAFHAGLPPEARAYAVPEGWGIRRFGFHGLSCAWALGRAAAVLEIPADRLRLVVCHLGGGASVTAIAGGRSVDTTMGFTPLEGLVMATRSGDVDPGALLWLIEHGRPAASVLDDLEHRSGLWALSGAATSDMRDLLTRRDAGDERSRLAVGVYVHRLRAKVAAMAAATGGTDAIVFTAGVGEGSAAIRGETAAGLAWMGVAIDESVGGEGDRDVSAAQAAVRTLVVHAREDLQIAAECRRLLE
jgi:acetate kinase